MLAYNLCLLQAILTFIASDSSISIDGRAIVLHRVKAYRLKLGHETPAVVPLTKTPPLPHHPPANTIRSSSFIIGTPGAEPQPERQRFHVHSMDRKPFLARIARICIPSDESHMVLQASYGLPQRCLDPTVA